MNWIELGDGDGGGAGGGGPHLHILTLPLCSPRGRALFMDGIDSEDEAALFILAKSIQ